MWEKCTGDRWKSHWWTLHHIVCWAAHKNLRSACLKLFQIFSGTMFSLDKDSAGEILGPVWHSTLLIKCHFANYFGKGNCLLSLSWKNDEWECGYLCITFILLLIHVLMYTTQFLNSWIMPSLNRPKRSRNNSGDF